MLCIHYFLIERKELFRRSNTYICVFQRDTCMQFDAESIRDIHNFPRRKGNEIVVKRRGFSESVKNCRREERSRDFLLPNGWRRRTIYDVVCSHLMVHAIGLFRFLLAKPRKLN